ncbi:MAG TPA: alpha/beta hydrolase [Terriglobales bacterium]|nr:alpha/beta hydrolase [Terriglobales bacterium]
MQDDDLSTFAAQGAAPLPQAETAGHVEHDGARIWYASYGPAQAKTDKTVILLHGGLGHSGNWGYQVPALTEAGYRVVVIDSRGHGRSTRDERPYTYELMASDVIAVMDQLGIDQAAFVGWSDGACIALVLAAQHPARSAGVFFFACNMDPSGTKPFDESNPLIGRCFGRHSKDYAALSATPDQFQDFVNAVSEMMKTEPNYTAADLARIKVPVTVALGEHDEFIKPEHADYLAAAIPGARRLTMRGVSHFAPLQRPALFNATILDFLGKLLA